MTYIFIKICFQLTLDYMALEFILGLKSFKADITLISDDEKE